MRALRRSRRRSREARRADAAARAAHRRRAGRRRQDGAFLSIAARPRRVRRRARTPSSSIRSFKQMGQAAGRLSAEAMLDAARAARQARSDGRHDRRRQRVADRMSDSSVAQFVAGSVIAERGADRSARARVPGPRARHAIGSASCSRWPQSEVAASELGQEAVVPGAVGEASRAMLTSYSDENFVSTQYGARAGERARPRRRRRGSRATIRPSGSPAGSAPSATPRCAALDHQLLARSPRHRGGRRRAGATSRETVDRARRRPGARRLLRPGAGSSPRRSSIEGGRSAEARSRTARAALERFGRGVDDEARRRAPAHAPTTTATSGSSGCATRSGTAGDRAARRSALERTGRAVAPAAARHPGRVRRAGPRVGAAADERRRTGRSAGRPRSCCASSAAPKG